MAEVKARILLWGISGAGKSTALQTICAKLRPELRGELRQEPTALDPTVHYESLPILLGRMAGVESQIEVIAVPGSPDQAMTRKQLLDEVDGVVLVLDCAPERIEANWPAIEELRASLADYGRRLEDVPLVLQYNKRDIADPFAIEALHRRIGLDQAAVFETTATTGDGVLATLTTISKHVVRAHRNRLAGESGSSVSTGAPPAADPNAASQNILEAAILAEGEGGDAAEVASFELDRRGTSPDWQAIASDAAKPEAGLGHELRIVSVGQASLESDQAVRIPLVLGDDAGQTRSVVLSLRLDALPRDGSD